METAFGKSERDSPEVQQAKAVQKDDQASPTTDILRQKGERQMDKTPTPEGSTTEALPVIKTSWTIMLYIAADDTLANFAVESLKQLNKSASARTGATDAASVVVAAHFAFPADPSISGSAKGKGPSNNTVHQYIFKADSSESHNSMQVRTLPKPVKTSEKTNSSDEANTLVNANLSEEVALKQFLDWAYKECNAEHYALILWGHGPELLFQPIESDPNGDRNNLYLTPQQLRGALEEWQKGSGTRLDVIGFDACSMSMFEMAYELNGLAKYMVASQDDVPDLSFPYDNLIELFRKLGNKDLESLLMKGVDGYVNTYKDCICNTATGMKAVTLSALNLNKCDALENAVRLLADELTKAKDEPGLGDRLIKARKLSKDYVGGLYVDLHDFCTNLRGQVSQKSEWQYIESACQSVLDALNQGKSNLILKNSDDDRGHGVSIYLPYLTDAQYAQVSKPLVKGGELTHGVKGYSDMLNGAATEYLMCARRNLILDTENYYGRLKFADTHWYDFIAGQWNRALIEKVPAALDYHYSAQQSWMNITRTKRDTGTTPGPAEPSVPPEAEMCVRK
jgi:hypothetical protein